MVETTHQPCMLIGRSMPLCPPSPSFAKSYHLSDPCLFATSNNVAVVFPGFHRRLLTAPLFPPWLPSAGLTLWIVHCLRPRYPRPFPHLFYRCPFTLSLCHACFAQLTQPLQLRLLFSINYLSNYSIDRRICERPDKYV